MIYLFVLLLIFVGIYQYDLNRRKPIGSQGHTLYFVIAFTLFFIAAFRYYNGGDTINYVEFFAVVPSWSDISIYHFDAFRYPKGYIYFAALIKELWDNFLAFQILVALFVNVVIFRFIKKFSPFLFLTTLVYFMLNYFEFNMEIMRESISVALGLLAYECFRSKRYIRMVLLIFIAYEFHVSALVLIFMPLLALVKYSKTTFLTCVVLALILPTLYLAIPNLELYADLIFNQEDWITESYVIQEFSDTLTSNFYVTHVLKALIIPFASLWYIHRRHIKFEFAGMVYAYALLQLLSMFTYAFYRFANYFAPFYWIAIAYVIFILMTKHRPLRSLLFIAVFVLLIYLYQHTQFMWDDNNLQYYYNRYIPYESVITNQGY